MRVAAHEIHGTVEERLRAHQPGHLLPPPPGHARVSDLRATEHPYPKRHAVLGDLREPGSEGDTPDLPQLQPVVFAAPAGRGELSGCCVSRSSIPVPRSATASLLTSIWSATIVGIRSSTSEALAMRTASVPSPSSYQRRRRPGALTSVHSLKGSESPLREHFGGLAHHHKTGAEDRVGQSTEGVEQGAEVEILRSRERMQARSHRLMRVLEDPQLSLAAAAQDRRVRPVVHLDRIDERVLFRRHRLAPGQTGERSLRGGPASRVRGAPSTSLSPLARTPGTPRWLSCPGCGTNRRDGLGRL